MPLIIANEQGKSPKFATEMVNPKTGKVVRGAAALAIQGKAGPGRPKGSQDKINREVAELVREALEKAHPDGAVAYLAQQANKSPAAFLALVGRLMPTRINADLNVNSDLAARLDAATRRVKRLVA